LLAISVYVCGGLAIAGAGRAEWQALALAPAYIAWKLVIYARALRPAERGWQRTERVAANNAAINRFTSIVVSHEGPETVPFPSREGIGGR
jgi:hypothetical protein